MKRFLLLAVIFVGLAAVAWGEDASSPDPALRIRHLDRNRALMQKLIDGGLQLAGEEDHLKRAECCNGLVRSLAEEMRQSVAENEDARVAELGHHVNALLERGVAANLTWERRRIPMGSAREKELLRVSDQAATNTRPLEEQLRRAAGRQNMQRTLEALQDGQAAVERAIRIRK